MQNTIARVRAIKRASSSPASFLSFSLSCQRARSNFAIQSFINGESTPSAAHPLGFSTTLYAINTARQTVLLLRSLYASPCLWSFFSRPVSEIKVYWRFDMNSVRVCAPMSRTADRQIREEDQDPGGASSFVHNISDKGYRVS